MKGQLPKAYLRIDPNLDQTHPDPGAFVRLLCAAARQPKRGRFKTRLVAEQALGKKRVGAFLAGRDLIEREGILEVDGWDIWQEGDFTVGERMRRFRARHTTVTSPFPVTPETPLPPSEASGVKASRNNSNGKRTSVALAPGSWSAEACDDWIGRFGGTAPGGPIGKALKPLVTAHGWAEVRIAWGAYLNQAEAEYASAQRFASTYGRWSGTVPGGGRESVTDKNRRVIEAYKRPGEE